MNDIPFYADWKFWSFAASGIAILLSQIPPLRLLLKRAKLDVEAYSRILIHHKIGNPNANQLISLKNTGGKELKIKSFLIEFNRDNISKFTIVGHNYFEKFTDTESIPLTSFRLAPNEEWSHVVQFFDAFSRSEDKEYRLMESNLRANIIAKRVNLVDQDTSVAGDPEVVTPIMDFFAKKFKWEPGEYEMTLTVKIEPEYASVIKKFRFTLFESDSSDLKEMANDYKFGAGVSYNIPKHSGLSIMIVGL